ncbi:hypothetical protein VZT92_016513 [Zoarces viviparus]|uniref:Uncharacterized protein n=1 Tax=Zoarces viviparus TaxID=48416 RepID=A0AAW1ETD0_ZOAVI
MSGARSEVSINDNALRFFAAGRKETPPWSDREVLLIDAVQKRPVSGKAGSFYEAITASTGRRSGSPGALKSRSSAIMLHRASGEIIPGLSFHTCPLIFTSQRKGLCEGGLRLHSLVLFVCATGGDIR